MEWALDFRDDVIYMKQLTIGLNKIIIAEVQMQYCIKGFM